jgi:hypothetical protein
LASCPTAKGIFVDGCPVFWWNSLSFFYSHFTFYSNFSSVNIYPQLIADAADNYSLFSW